MAEDEANFDIDLYDEDEAAQQADVAQKPTDAGDQITKQQGAEPSDLINYDDEDDTHTHTDDTFQVDNSKDQSQAQQGLKRKGGPEEKPVDVDAQAAVVISDLPWYTTEDEIRGWANQAGCEGQLKSLTFNEHKVNGKSKGQVYIDFESPQAAMDLKQKIESFYTGKPGEKKYAVAYSPSGTNPFHTLPKDPQGRATTGNQRGGGNFTPRGNFEGGFRGSRGGMGRGGMVNSGGFRGGYQGGNMGMGGFGNNQVIGGFNAGGFNGGFGGRGGGNMMMGGRGGRGGRGGMNPMASMPMAGMMPNMMAGMPMMGGAMGGFNMGGNQQMPFNAFFQGQQQQQPQQPHMGGGSGGAGGGGGEWNPHGAKRPREF